MQEMLRMANARGIVLIAAVGNAGPKSQPLYPAADAAVIGVTATDAEDRLMPQANRGPQVSVAAPGVRSWRVRRTASIRSLPATRFLPAIPAALRAYWLP